ncbi:MAG: 2-dehydro-3-deoxygalactonokinase [Rhodoferax sp.]
MSTMPSGNTALVAVDWGTSALRAARLSGTGEILEERASPQGILAVQPGQFATIFEANYADWIRANNPICLISGMAGSKQGWVEAPYCPCPAGFDDVAARLRWIDEGPRTHRIAIVPGLSCEHAHAPDVMRGEEVQILGAMQLTGQREGIFVLPGTHSKWVRVEQGRVRHFKTCMTGEVFGLLAQQSILAKTVNVAATLDEAAFQRGVGLAAQGQGLLHNAFSARTLSLFNRLDADALASYLSGLVIGEELQAQRLEPGQQVVVIGSDSLTHRYALALGWHGIGSRRLGSESTWAGLFALFKALKL